jgi:hypothetical protein
VTLTDTMTSSNSVGATGSAIMVRNSTVSNKCGGNSVDQNAVARVSQTTITSNGVGTMVVGYRLAQTNNVSGNTTDGAAGGMLAAVGLMTASRDKPSPSFLL